jgi:hypothetical protein
MSSDDREQPQVKPTQAPYPDAGHGGIFPFRTEFVAQALEFLAR